MSSVPCRNGVGCTRPDCWYAHPDGRVNAAAASAAPRAYGGAPSRGGAAAGGGNPGNICRFGRGCHREDCYYSHPDGRDIDDAQPPNGAISAGPGAASAAAARAQQPKAPISPASGRSDFNPDEWEGPDEDGGGDFNAADADIAECECCGGKPLECQTPSCKAVGKCGCMLGEAADEDAEDDTLGDEWFPASRDCPCCHGTIYRCSKQQDLCQSGTCFCSHSKQ